jgi:PhzF family phenazine biosynthesis protein
MTLRFYVIDAFAAEPFSGNPAAVVLDARGLSDQRMQAMASEFNLSETAFVFPLLENGGDPQQKHSSEERPAYNIRWFTPTAEVDMCGHATIAAVHALVETGQLPIPDDADSTAVHLDTRSGVLTAFVESVKASHRPMLWLDLVDPTLRPLNLAVSDLTAVLRIPADAVEDSLPIVRTQDGDAIMFVRSFGALHQAQPRFDALAELLRVHDLRGLCVSTVATLTPSMNVQSRFFAPGVGVNEDPVTGSVHGPLAAYLVGHDLVGIHDGLAAVTCTQGLPGGRTGILYVLAQPKFNGVCSVRIGGHALTTMRGDLIV